MSKTAILSDIHSNLPALKEVLREAQASGTEHVVFLGDIVGYGAWPAECVEWVRKLGGNCVMGNHEESMVLVRQRGKVYLDRERSEDDYFAGLLHSAKSVSDEQADWLAGLPFVMEIPGAVAAHANLHHPSGWNYISDIATAGPTLEVLRQGDSRVGFFGHTHEQGIFPDEPAALEWLDETRVKIPAGMACAITVGSVGQPRHQADRRATWVLWDPAAGVVEFRKTAYNRIEAAQGIAKAGLPMVSAMRLLTEPELAFLEI
jgi:diadenosine tetraphosphatase ApaH/serine/threonine PP2A family protein phosphatase